jgi:hypothetical protein
MTNDSAKLARLPNTQCSNASAMKNEIDVETTMGNAEFAERSWSHYEAECGMLSPGDCLEAVSRSPRSLRGIEACPELVEGGERGNEIVRASIPCTNER